MNQKSEKPIIIHDFYPDLSPEDRAEVQENLQEYVRIVWKIFNRLKAEGKLEDVMLRAQWEKRNRHKPASQNINAENDDI